MLKRQDERNRTYKAIVPVKAHPPTIPNHFTMYGYDIDQEGELVRQIAHVDGFTGEGTSRVGPADYDLTRARHAVARNVKGIVTWKIPQKEARKPVVIPGPADYAKLES